MAVLELNEVCKGWDKPVLDRVSLRVPAGEFFVLVGPSGIGKTTLLRCIAGLEALDAGQVIVHGQDITHVPPYRRNVALTFESYALYPHLTVFENIASPLRARRMPNREVRQRVQKVAELLRIEQLLQRKPGEVSGGQKQRTALGRTLVREPDVFLLDEPISHLDAKIRHELRTQFHQLEDLRRTATLYVTHDYAEALSLGDRIGVMGRGGLVQVGTARGVFERPENLFVARHLGQPTINDFPVGLRREGDHVVAGADGLALPVHPGHIAALTSYARNEVVLAIRPQHIHAIVPDAVTRDAVVDGRVEVYEALGANGVLKARVGEHALTALTAPERMFDFDEPVRLAIESENALYFDPVTGRNILLDYA